MTGGGPAFSKVIHDEIALYGFAGATVLAHIRFRCGTDGPGRFVADGIRWWEVSLADLGAELYVSKDVAQRAIKRLGNAVTAKRFGPPGDQTRAYHVAAYPTSQNAESHQLDLPERDSASASRPEREIAPGPTRYRTGTDAISHSLPLSGEAKEGGEGSGASGQSTDSLDAGELANSEPAAHDPGKPRDDLQPPLTQSRNNDHARVDTTAGTPPSPYCRRHPGGTQERCRDCGDARKLREAWDAEQSERANAERAAGLAAIEACPACDPNGFVELDTAAGTSVRRCDLHPSKADLPTVTP